MTNRNSSPSPYLKLFRYIRFPLILISFSVCNYSDRAANDCHQLERIVDTDIWKTTRLCKANTCQDGSDPYTKHEDKFDEECKKYKKKKGFKDWKSYKCCARPLTTM